MGQVGRSPLVLSSPHSGRDYPADFRPLCSDFELRSCEDALVDELLQELPAMGVPLLLADFPRSYIDVNRAEQDHDLQLVPQNWQKKPQPSEKLKPSERAQQGQGLIRRLVRAQVPLYTSKLTAEDINNRIDNYYQPYHAALRDLLEKTHAAFGVVYHLDMHSMPAIAVQDIGAPDIVLGDRCGQSCGDVLLDAVKNAFAQSGFSWSYNVPYQGVEILRRYGRPQNNVHCLQIEINRKLYFNEDTQQPNAGFAQTKARLTTMLSALASSLSANLTPEKLP